MNHKKIANANHEEVACMTSRSTSRHGLSDGMVREKRARNRAAKRLEAKAHFADQLDHDDKCTECGEPFPSHGNMCADCVTYMKYCVEPDYDILDAFDDLAPEQDFELPDDYEECGDCGYDHAYEQDEAFHAHSASH